MKTEENKSIVRLFNEAVIEKGDIAVFDRLMAKSFRNHSAPLGADNGPGGMIHTFNHILRPALKDLKVTIHQQIAEGDLVTTRKTISGIHEGPLMGIQPTKKIISIDVIDIVRIDDGKYIEHWGLNTLTQVLNALRTSA